MALNDPCPSISPSSIGEASLLDPLASSAALVAAIPYIEAILSKLESGVLLVDAKRRILFANEAMAALLGLTVNEVMQMSPETFAYHIRDAVDEPPEIVRQGRLLPADTRILCEEFEIRRPQRSVVRWVVQEVLFPSGAGQVAICTDITAEVDLAAAHEKLALTDRLTELINRRGAEEALKREEARAHRYRSPISFVLFDIDHFKKINDVYGHPAGDLVLKQVAQTLVASMRKSDLIARWGGEEFLAILPETTADTAYVCAERIRIAVEKIRTPFSNPVTVSAGLTELNPMESVEEAISRADERLYQAKRAGRNCIINLPTPLQEISIDSRQKRTIRNKTLWRVTHSTVRIPGGANQYHEYRPGHFGTCVSAHN